MEMMKVELIAEFPRLTDDLDDVKLGTTRTAAKALWERQRTPPWQRTTEVMFYSFSLSLPMIQGYHLTA